MATALWAAALPVASGHVAPAVDRNNRYLKLSPLGDRVRLAYTVFFGEIPGAAARAAMDVDRDGQLSDSERQKFGQTLAAQVGTALDLEVDGSRIAVLWENIDIGLDTPAVAAGAFAVDLVTQVCVSSEAELHRILLRDSWPMPHPGETEVTVEDTPGVRIESTRLGDAEAASASYRLGADDTALASAGLRLQFRVSSTWRASGRCAHRPAPARHGPRWGIAVAGLVAALATAAFVKVRRRRGRRESRPTDG